MTKYVKYILFIITSIILMLYLLDFLYTNIYTNTSNPRNKVSYIVNSNTNKNYDVIILGSSRAENHFIISEFDRNNIIAYNLGMSGASLQENYLQLLLMIDKEYKIKNIILQVDLNLNSEGHSEGNRAKFLPYINSEKVIHQFFKDQIEDDCMFFMPMYRYAKYDSQIGFREFFFTITNKKSKFISQKGFMPLNGVGENMSHDLSKCVARKNIYYEKIKKICIDNAINLIPVTTPMCKNTTNINYFIDLQKVYPEIYNLESVVDDDKYFSSCGHMNKEGAILFTDFIINKFKLK